MQPLAYPVDNETLTQAWESFMIESQLDWPDKAIADPAILRSWQRCIYRLDPKTRPHPNKASHQVEVEGFTCLVENAGNMGIPGVSLASDVSISDGLLDAFCVYNLDFNSLTSAVKSITNQPLDPESFRHWRAREVTIVSDPPQPVVGDGEKWGGNAGNS
jgi:hypothetical protein